MSYSTLRRNVLLGSMMGLLTCGWILGGCETSQRSVSSIDRSGDKRDRAGDGATSGERPTSGSVDKSGRDLDSGKPPVKSNGHSHSTASPRPSPSPHPTPHPWPVYAETAPDDSDVVYETTSTPIVHADGFWKVPVFFGTDRKPGVERDDWYGTDRGVGLVYGQCVVTLPDAREPGELPRPRDWWIYEEEENPHEHVTLASVDVLSVSAFKQKLQSRVNTVSRKDVLLFVHGYKTRFADAAYRTAQLAFDLKFYSPVVMFSWPSDGTLDAYGNDEESINLSDGPFRQFLSDLRESTEGASLHVIAHSMGNRLVTQVLSEIAAEEEDQPPLVESFILAAPDVGVEAFRTRFDAILRAAKGVTIYASSKDKPLLASQVWHSGPRIGMPGDHLREFCEDGRITVIDATDVGAAPFAMLHHSYVGNNRCVLDDVRLLLSGASVTDRGLIERGFMLAMNRCTH